MLHRISLCMTMLALVAACPEETTEDAGSGGPGVFAIDPYPSRVRSSPLSITGTKPAGFGVNVDGAERVARAASTTWSVDLDLLEGSNSFAFAPVDPSGAAGAEEVVSVALDTTPPSVVSTTPASGATEVPFNTNVTVVFSEIIDCATVTSAVFAIQNVSSTLSCTAGSTTISLSPDSDLAPSSSYTVTLFSDVSDLAGNTMAGDNIWIFQTGDAPDVTPPPPPTIDNPAPPQFTAADTATVGGSKELGSSVWSSGVEIVPPDGLATWNHDFSLSVGDNAFSLTARDTAANESTATTFSVTRVTGAFSVDTYPTLVTASPQNVTGTKPTGYGTQVDSVQQVAPDQSQTWSVDLALGEGANSFLIEPVDPTGTAGTGETVDITLDTTPPQVSTRVPDTDATDVSISTGVQAVFSEEVDCATVDAARFTVSGVTATPSCAVDTVTLTPPADLTEGTLYTVTAGAAIEDLAGNAMGSDVSWSFTTGIIPDTTPPVAPTANSPAPNTPTTGTTMTVGGTKETDANVEFRWEVDAVEQQTWTQIAPKDAATSWSNDFDLNLGSNFFQLRSVDPSNNISTSTTDFTILREPPVAAPTVNVVSPTTVGTQLVTGTKPANTSVWDGLTEIVPRDGSATWHRYLQLNPGDNNMSLTAQNAAAESSPPLDVTITYNVPPDVPGAARLQITMDLQDMWNYIGDEYWAGDLGGCNLNHFGIDIWLEGPITPGESCMFDSANHQRMYTRYVATVQHGCYWNANPGPPPAPCHNYWWEPNYRSPNYLAALIEGGVWANTAHPLPRDVDRRTGNGEQWMPGNNVLHYQDAANWKPRMYSALVDGMTEASVNPAQSNSVGPPLGEWVGPQSITWTPQDRYGGPLRQGPYLINITVTVDRTGPANTAHDTAYRLTDRETCWNMAGHQTEGMNRAEGIIVLGPTDATLYLHERGKDTVDGCHSLATPIGTGTAENRIRCSCDHSIWPCCDDARCTYKEPLSIPALIGGPVEMMTRDRFADPIGDGQDYAVEVKYCASGSC